jgi:hypothetical protein
LFLPAFIKVKHLDVLLLRNSLCSSQTTLLCLLVLNLCMRGSVHANSRCGHVSIDWVWHNVQLILGYMVG